jgi:tripartite-type tricarboxylate transporter receptor subunit TctC
MAITKQVYGMAVGIALCGAVHDGFAQTYPNRPVRMLHGFAAGANVDTIARVMSPELGRLLGQTVIVEPQAGAGGTIAAASVARAKPDGYTLLMGTGSHSVAGALYEKLPYDTEKSFSSISTVTFFAFAVTASAAGRYHNLNDLVAYARANPGRVNYGSSGSGSTNHLAGEVLAKMTNTQMVHVPYKGFAPALTALLGGEIDFVVGSASSVLGNVKAGKMRVLAMAAPRRWSGMPDVQTSFEQGLNGYDMSSWAGLMAPADLPRAIVERLNADTQKVLQIAAIKTTFEELGGDPRGSTPAEMSALIASELQRWTQVVNDAKIPKL